jgi:hypothetical protein
MIRLQGLRLLRAKSQNRHKAEVHACSDVNGSRREWQFSGDSVSVATAQDTKMFNGFVELGRSFRRQGRGYRPWMGLGAVALMVAAGAPAGAKIAFADCDPNPTPVVYVTTPHVHHVIGHPRRRNGGARTYSRSSFHNRHKCPKGWIEPGAFPNPDSDARSAWGAVTGYQTFAAFDPPRDPAVPEIPTSVMIAGAAAAGIGLAGSRRLKSA